MTFNKTAGKTEAKAAIKKSILTEGKVETKAAVQVKIKGATESTQAIQKPVSVEKPKSGQNK